MPQIYQNMLQHWRMMLENTLKSQTKKKSQPCKSPFPLQSWADSPWHGSAAWGAQRSPTVSRTPQCCTVTKGLKVMLSSLADIPPIFKTASRAWVGFQSLVVPCSPGTVHIAGTEGPAPALPAAQGSKAQAKRSAAAILTRCHRVRLRLIFMIASQCGHNPMVMQVQGDNQSCSRRRWPDSVRHLLCSFLACLGVLHEKSQEPSYSQGLKVNKFSTSKSLWHCTLKVTLFIQGKMTSEFKMCSLITSGVIISTRKEYKTNKHIFLSSKHSSNNIMLHTREEQDI